MTDGLNDADDRREQARAALAAALGEAARRALEQGIPPEALTRYAEERIAALRRSVGDPADADAGPDGPSDEPRDDIADEAP